MLTDHQQLILEHLLKFGKFVNKAFVLHGPYARDLLSLLIGYEQLYLLSSGVRLDVRDKFEKPAVLIAMQQ